VEIHRAEREGKPLLLRNLIDEFRETSFSNDKFKPKDSGDIAFAATLYGQGLDGSEPRND
jgi:hypothetical protein